MDNITRGKPLTFPSGFQDTECKTDDLQVGIMYFSMAGNGIVYDRWGPVPLLVVGTFLHVFGLMMASLSTQYYQIMFSQSICSALGASALFTAATSPVGSWFLKRRALAFGIVASGSSLGGVILP